MRTLPTLRWPLMVALLGCNAESTSSDGPETDAGPCAPASATASVVLDLPARPQMDVLFVVDDSGSMCEEQGRLTDAFREIAADIVASGVDYRMAVTTTDLRTPANGGRFRDAPPVQNPDAPACPAAAPTPTVRSTPPRPWTGRAWPSGRSSPTVAAT